MDAPAQLFSEEHGAKLLHPFDDWPVIYGQGTLALELFEQAAERPLGTLLAFLYPASLVTLTLWIAGILQIVPWIA